MLNWLTGIFLGACVGACLAAWQHATPKEGLIAACVGGAVGAKVAG